MSIRLTFRNEIFFQGCVLNLLPVRLEAAFLFKTVPVDSPKFRRKVLLLI